MSTVIARLAEFIENENKAIRNYELHKIAENRSQKELLTLELSRLRKSAAGTFDNMEDAKRLQAALEENHKLLEIHCKAASEISDLLAEAAVKHHSDGTYTHPVPGMGVF